MTLDPDVGADWVVRAQDGQAAAVIAEVDAVLSGDPSAGTRVRALYARAIALQLEGSTALAVGSARELAGLCRDLGLAAQALRARALLVELLRRAGEVEQAVEQLAHAVTIEHGLTDLRDPQVQSALGALAIALRLSGLSDEAHRVEDRLAAVEDLLDRDHRVSRWSNLALEHASAALAAARRAPFRPDGELLARARSEIERAAELAADASRGASYGVVADERAVLRGLHAAVDGDPAAALDALDRCRTVLDRGPEATAIRVLWAVGRVHALLRLHRSAEAVAEGRTGLDLAGGWSPGDDDQDVLLALAYQVLLAEEADGGSSTSAARRFADLAQARLGRDDALLLALFRSRVDLLRGAEDRRRLARSASLDSLTGLVNRRGAAVAVTAAAGRPSPEGALLLVDLDGFAALNDRAGNLAGDAVLQRVAAALRMAVRPEDVVARWGADEFLVVADLDAARARVLAERLREAVRECAEPGADDAVTASVGLAVRTGPVEDDGWLGQADAALFAAKRQGGDRVVVS